MQLMYMDGSSMPVYIVDSSFIGLITEKRLLIFLAYSFIAIFLAHYSSGNTIL